MNKHGSILFTVLIILVLVLLGAAILVRSANENKLALRLASSEQAFWLADAGVQRTVFEITSNNCHGMVQAGTATACSSCTSCGGGSKTLAATLSGVGDYDITLNSSNTSVTAVGSAPSRTATNKIQRTLQGTIGVRSPFSFAAFAQGQVTLDNNAYIDSYDSDDGAYNVATNSYANGDVGSNGTTAGIIDVGSNVYVGGDLSTGAGGTVDLGAGADIAGTTTHENDIDLPPVDVPADVEAVVAGGVKLVGNGATWNVPAGNYKYTSLDLRNNSTVNITGGTVKLYLTGAAALATQNNITVNIASGASLELYVDGVFNTMNNITFTSVDQKPKDFQIYSTYTGADGVSIKNNGNLYIAVYAPETDVDLGNNNYLYGSVIGETVLINNNTAIHYDETLASLNTSNGPTGITLWQEP